MAFPGALSVAPMTRFGDVQSTLTVSQIVNGFNYRTVMQEAKQNAAKHFSVVMRDPTTGLGAVLTSTILAGLTVQIKKGSLTSYSTITPTLTIVGTTGLLDIAFTGPHFDTLGVAAVNVSGPGVLANDDLFIDVVAIDKTDAIRAGLTAIPNAAAGVTGGLPTLGASIPDANAGANGGLPTLGGAIPNVTFGTSGGLPTKQNVDDDATAVIAAINAHTDAALAGGVPTAALIRDAVLDALLSDHTVSGSVADGVAIAAGLLQGNFVMDSVDNTDPNGQTSARIRLFRTGTAAGAATSGGTGQGEFATLLVTTAYSAPGKVSIHKVVRQ
jgi:hypothetical protein